MLRAPRPGDGAAVCAAVAESLPQLRAFLGALPWIAAEPTVDGLEAWCRTAAGNFIARRDMPFLMFEHATGQYLGTIGLHRPDWDVPRCEVGYWCRTSRAGSGFVMEGVQAVCELAFQNLHMQRLEAVTDAANTASRRVAERCGFSLEGVLRNERRASGGSLRDTCIYARLPSEAVPHA